MEITVEQLQELLVIQKQLLIEHFDKVWRTSDFVKELKLLDPDDKLANKMHEIRDKLWNIPFPNDLQVLKKYKVK